MILFKEIPLYPTKFFCDIWVSKDDARIYDLFHKQYGASIEHYKETLSQNQVANIISTDNSVMKGEIRIVANISDLNDDAVIVHESYHIFSHLAKLVGLELKAQEWTAYMIEYIYEKIKDSKTYLEV